MYAIKDNDDILPQKAAPALLVLTLLLTERFLTFRCVEFVKIKDTDDVFPVKDVKDNSRDGNYSFELCPLHAAHAWKSLSEK